MPYPYFRSALPPLGARSSDLRPNPARRVDDSKTNPLRMHFESAVAVHACCDLPTGRSERHPRKILTDPTDEVTVEFTPI